MFRTVSVMFALFGIAVNIALMATAISNAYDAHGAHQNLQKDAQYYSRPRRVAPAPRRPVRLWAAQAALMMSAGFGFLLAIDLLTATAWLGRKPLESRRGLERYIKWKAVGALATGLLFLWAGTEHYFFWVTATQHAAVGSGPPAMLAALMLTGAILPQRWVQRGLTELPAVTVTATSV